MSDAAAQLLAGVLEIKGAVGRIEGDVSALKAGQRELSADLGILAERVSAHPQPCPFVAYQAEHPEATEPGRALARRKSDRMRMVWRIVAYVLGGGAAAMGIVGGILTILDRL